MPEYRDEPKQFLEPSREEVRARSLRNIAIAIGLVGFMALVAISVIARSPV